MAPRSKYRKRARAKRARPKRAARAEARAQDAHAISLSEQGRESSASSEAAGGEKRSDAIPERENAASSLLETSKANSRTADVGADGSGALVAEQETVALDLQRAAPPASEDDSTGPVKILVVEDGHFLRMGIGRALARAGYRVVTAGDGEAAIEAARKSRPDLILLDLLLPKIGGEQVLKTLKSDPATSAIAVVVLTALSQKNAEKLQSEGALAFLEKSELALEKSAEVLLAALSSIVQSVPELKQRKRAAARAGGN